jgi:type I restriction enzyme R subunit
LLYETFLDKDERQKFETFFKDIEASYEILSPSPELRDYIEDYNRLADIYVMLRIAYGKKTRFFGRDRSQNGAISPPNASAHGIDRLTEAVDLTWTRYLLLKTDRQTATERS